MKSRAVRISLLALALIAPSGFAQDGAAPVGGSIDDMLESAWKELKIRPAKAADDHEFLRRVTLDITGTIPTPEEIEAFVSKSDSRKRRKKIDELLASDAWAEYWAERLTGIFAGYRDNLYPALTPLNRWLTARLGEGAAYDRIARELITASGRNDQEDGVAFVLQHAARDRTKKALTVQVAKVFLGIQLQCAQCHDHPFEPWKKSDFESMVAFFGLTDLRVVERMEANRDSIVEVVDAEPRRRFRARGPRPKFLDGTSVDPVGARLRLALLVTRPDDLRFARATVNRIWAEFFGRGFVEPVDDFSSRNEPSFPELLNLLAAGFVGSGHDLRWLMRTIANSRPYQLSSDTKARKGDDLERMARAYAVQIVRPMSAEQSVNVLETAQGVGSFAPRAGGMGGDVLRRRIVQQFVLGSGSETSVSPSEYNASMQQVMQQLNEDQIYYRGIRARGTVQGTLGKILARTRRPEEVIAQLYLATLSRPPDKAELADCLSYWSGNGRNEAAYEDVFFVLLNANEFFFNH